MREQVEQRVSELRAELQKGQQMLAELEAKEAELRQTLLRISGAIQVLEELLTDTSPAPAAVPGAGPFPSAPPQAAAVPSAASPVPAAVPSAAAPAPAAVPSAAAPAPAAVPSAVPAMPGHGRLNAHA